MPERRRRSFAPRFKAQVVLEVLSGLNERRATPIEPGVRPFRGTRSARVCAPPVRPLAAAFGHSGQLGRHPRGTDENRAESPSAIVGWVRTASRSAV